MVTEDGMKMKNFMKTSQKLARGSPSLTNEVGFNPFANDAKTLLSKISDWVCFVGIFPILCFSFKEISSFELSFLHSFFKVE